MLTGLAVCSQVDYSYNKLKGMGLDEKTIETSLGLIENGVWEYMKRNGGRAGYHLID